MLTPVVEEALRKAEANVQEQLREAVAKYEREKLKAREEPLAGGTGSFLSGPRE